MITVEADAAAVERRLTAGGLSCPDCASAVVGWGHGRERSVRGPAGLMRLRPRRCRCAGCGVTHVLLPVVALLRRADLAAVIGAALAAKAAGAGHRRIAQALERPAETVRGWLRRFAGRLEAVRGVFTVWLRALDPDPVMPDPGGGAWADAMIAISLATTAAARRFVLMVSPWEVAVAVSGGRLLAPGWPGEWINTSSP
ncbi:hypothetical protein DMA12_26495 [Amycolatopsis balhimycina DSM 5908]|uniref:Uncharacterized protein n=1 Tax=Amycolatopsis balhimycina DSM 5908 TaxID=1081091 RepID=A0A428WCQ7_AMYBA|nr:hypothetical protein DMA12_26495 [Amycolatopsis balhimycina DSM 5908]